VCAVSSFYETEPVELKDQAWFLNCVVEVETEWSAAELLEALLSIERAMGRERVQAKGPRNIDIDILLFGDAVIDEKGLKVPHPAMHRRRFVLAPLAEIAPDAIHPVFKRSARELLEALAEGDVVRKCE
jgi:2-amino-4-hydroxy-6-hydroxymethyldihydropteridine diphosphokinase